MAELHAEYEIGSGNVFADLALADAQALQFKADIAARIISTIDILGLNQTDAGKRMNLPQARVSALYNGKFFNISEKKLMECLNRLGYDIEISIKPSRQSIGHLTFSAA